MLYKKLFLGSLLTLSTLAVFAHEHDDDDDDSGVMLGAMIARDNSIYVGGKDQTQVMPFFSGQWGRYFIEGPSIGAHLFQHEGLTFSASIDLEGIGDDNRDESDILRDMGDFDSTYYATLSLEYEQDFGEFSLSLSSDISGTHDGIKTEMSYGYPFQLGGWMINPELSVEWNSEDVNNYFYGVSALNVKEDRPLYTASSGVNYELGVTALYPFMQRHAVMFMASYQSFSSEITNSPIVDGNNSTSFGVGYVYRF